MENTKNKFYLIGFFIILLTPVLVYPPMFFPPDWGKTIVFRSAMAILLFLFVCQFLFKRKEISLPKINSLKNNKIIWALSALFIIILLSILFSADIKFSLWGSPYRATSAVNSLFYIIFSVLAFLVIKSSDWEKIINFSIFTGLLVCAVAIFQFYGVLNHFFIAVPGRPPSTMGNPIMLAIYLILLFFITLSFAAKENRKNYKIFYWFAVLIFSCVILITGSRAAYLGGLIGGVYFILFYPVRKSVAIQPGEASKKSFVQFSNGVYPVRKSADIQPVESSKKSFVQFSNGVYLKKLFLIKIAAIVLFILGIFLVYCVNIGVHFPSFLENNKIFQAVQNRLSLDSALSDPRFSAWQVVFKAIKEKPIFGWGPENLGIGFDKYYDPSLPFLSKMWGGWWDRAHNIFLDISATTGIPSFIIYLLLFALIFWQMQKLKKKNYESSVMGHGIQATLIAYLIANIFSFDAFASYLIFFLLIGYSFHLIWSNSAGPALASAQGNTKNSNFNQQNKPWKKAAIAFLFILLVIFLWQYNLKPLYINWQIQQAGFLADNKKCGQAFSALNKVLPYHSFLDAYSRIKYVEAIKTCAEFYPEKNLEYATKGVELMKEATKIRPLYSRLWLFLGSFTTIKASAEKDATVKADLISQANSYFDKALQLAPKHQEILIENAKTAMVANNFQLMKEKAEKCATLDPSLGECYWIKALSEIYLKDFNQAKKDIKTADEKRFDTNTSVLSLHQLVNAYVATENYKELSLVYEKLIELNPSVAQYHSSLAFTYAKLGQYQKARGQALKFLEYMPEAKDEVNAFLKTLPY